MSSPLSYLYGLGVAARNTSYDRGILRSHRSGLKIVCVGNLTTGGSGKSPVTQAIARLLFESGLRPAILLRGYRGREAGPLVVGKERSPADVGDEACMHRDALPSVPVVVSRRRAGGARLIEEGRLARVVILDDGFQHRALARDVNLLLFDESGLADAETGKLLPAGNLREPLNGALRRASAVLLIERGGEISRPAWLPANIPSFRIPFLLGDCTDLKTGGDISWDEIRTKKVGAIASIAKPDQFLQMLRAKGLELTSELIGKDHELWDKKSVEKINALSAELLITTAKDAVKLSALSGIAKRIVAARLSAQLPDTFTQWLLTILS